MIKLGVPSTSAVSEPRTAATTTTAFDRFVEYAAFAAYETDGRLRGYWCLYETLVKEKQTEKHLKVISQSCVDMPLALNLRLQAFTPSDHL